MPPVGDDPVARRRRAAAAATSSAAAFATSARAPSSPRWRRRPAAAAPPRRPEPVAPLTDAAIAAAPNRIERNGIGDGGLVAAPAGRAVDLVRASQWIKRRNAPRSVRSPSKKKSWTRLCVSIKPGKCARSTPPRLCALVPRLCFLDGDALHRQQKRRRQIGP